MAEGSVEESAGLVGGVVVPELWLVPSPKLELSPEEEVVRLPLRELMVDLAMLKRRPPLPKRLSAEKAEVKLPMLLSELAMLGAAGPLAR